MLAVKTVLALDHAHMQGQPQGPGSLSQAACHVKIRHSGELDGGVLRAGVFEADGAGGHHDIPGLHVDVDAAAGAGADKGIGAALVELLHGDGGGGAADAGGAGRYLLPQEGAGPNVVLPVIGHGMGVVKERRDGLHPAGVPGQDAVAAHVAGDAADMELFLHLLHSFHSPGGNGPVLLSV